MITKALAIAALLAGTGVAARAGWTTETYQLQPGWNALYALNDAAHTTLDDLLAPFPAITEVWRWEPSELSAQFIGDPTQVVAGQEWKTWIRNDPTNTTINTLLPNFGYLVFVSGSSPITLRVTGRAVLNKIDWRASGANLVGFPAAEAPRPRFGGTTSGYLAPLAAIGYNPLQTEIFQYVGGPIGPANPARIGSPVSTNILRGKAYWISLQAYSDFVSPVEVELSSVSGRLEFGTRGGPQKILLTNRSAAPLSVAVTSTTSDPAPAGQEAVAGPVPLLRRVFDHTDQSIQFVPLNGPIEADLAPGESISWTLVPDRASMIGNVGDHHASVLRITDTGAHGSYSAFTVPVTAVRGDLGGLWVGEAVITQVQNQLQRFQRNPDGSNAIDDEGNYLLIDSADTLAPTAQPFRLRLIVHVDDSGTARLLSNVYFGALDVAGAPLGFATEQRFLRAESLESATRITATHLPLDVDAILAGGLGIGTQGSTTVALPHTAPTNPFVHTYHPDHDNLDARFQNPLPAGVESHTVTRAITLTVDASAPDGDPTWGAASLTGAYAETLTGLHKNTIATQGRFALSRVSEITTLQR